MNSAAATVPPVGTSEHEHVPGEYNPEYIEGKQVSSIHVSVGRLVFSFLLTTFCENLLNKIAYISIFLSWFEKVEKSK